MPSLGTPPGRLNLRVVAGEAVDINIPILDSDGQLVTSASSPGWSCAAQIRTSIDAEAPLFVFNTSISAGVVRVRADDVETLEWQDDWTRFRERWDLVVTDEDGLSHWLCAGWVLLYTTVTR